MKKKTKMKTFDRKQKARSELPQKQLKNSLQNLLLCGKKQKMRQKEQKNKEKKKKTQQELRVASRSRAGLKKNNLSQFAKLLERLGW